MTESSSSDVHEPWRKRVVSRVNGYQRWLIVVFLLTLPICNAWVRGDGVGYYAYARALLIEHNLDFRKDWEHGNETFAAGRLDAAGYPLANQYTTTGHIANLWSIGPSLLWLPFLGVTHLVVKVVNHFGGHVPADGFSAPYRVTLALATALYGFGGIWISFLLARKYFAEKWAFLAAVAIWGASSLPVYMYFNPSWSHAHSVFVVALFLWYWQRTRVDRTRGQFVLLGLISGLMVDVYYPNGTLLLIPAMEGLSEYAGAWNGVGDRAAKISRLFGSHLLYVATFAAGLLPTLVTRRVIFGSFTQTGYSPASGWNWTSPALVRVLLSSDHGALSWTPILIPAVAGVFLFRRVARSLASKLIVSTAAFYLLIALHPSWDGLSSFGNRFFISLTPIFILGLACFVDWLARAWNGRSARLTAIGATAVLILWNFGMMYQWGTHLIPARGPISWRQAVYNQFAVVPGQAARTFERYLLRRSQFMQHIEDEDMKQLKSHPPE